MSIPRQDSQLSHFLVFFCSQYLCVCLFWQLILAVLYIEWWIDPLFFPKGYELFFLCYILLVNSWSKPGADTRKLGLQSEKRAGGVYLSLTGWPAWVSELFSPNLCKAQMPQNLSSSPHSPWQEPDHPYMQHAVPPAPPIAMAKQVPWGRGHYMGCLCNRPPSLVSPLPASPRITS